MGDTCPICDMSNPPRDHVARHFIEELIEYCDRAMPGSLSCNECDYRGPQKENLAKHVALFHCKVRTSNFFNNTKSFITSFFLTPKAGRVPIRRRARLHEAQQLQRQATGGRRRGAMSRLRQADAEASAAGALHTPLCRGDHRHRPRLQ